MSRLKLILKYSFKDLSNQRGRTILGILGVMLSVSLLCIVLFVSDTVSVSFVDYLSRESGDQDMIIRVRHYNGEPVNRSSYFDFQEIIDKIDSVTDIVDQYIPRIEITGVVNISKSKDTNELTNIQDRSTVSGIDFAREKDLNYGTFLKPNLDPDSDDIEELKINSLPINHCAIYYGFNDKIKYAKGDTIRIKLSMTHGNQTEELWANLTVDAIFDYDLKWDGNYRRKNLIMVDITTIINLFSSLDDFNGKCNKLLAFFKDSANLYDSRDVEGSKRRVKEIVSDIQSKIGIEEYHITLPKLGILRFLEMVTITTTIIFIFAAIIGMLISGILINGILKTSIEERIREFGIFRTLGGYKKNNLSIVLIQGILICNIGCLIGIGFSYLTCKYYIVPRFVKVLIGARVTSSVTPSVELYVSPISIIIAYCMGVGVGLIVSIAPALKVMRLQLIESIHPYRHEDTLYHLRKKSSVNYKLIFIGLILACNGMFVFIVMPRLMLSNDGTLTAGVMITLLLIFLIGLTLAGLGVVPLVIRIFTEIFRPISGKLHEVIKIFIFRYQRRNSSTIIMCAMTFSFVLFVSTIVAAQFQQQLLVTRLRYGSDLYMESSGWIEEEEYDWGQFLNFAGGSFMSTSSKTSNYENNGLESQAINPMQSAEYDVDPSKILTTDFKYNLLSIDGIEKVSTVLATPSHLTQVYSEQGKIFSATISDYAGTSSSQIKLYGIDEEYPSTINAIDMTFTKGTREEAFDELFNNEDHYHCIISESIAVDLYLELNDKIRITVERGLEVESYPFRICGMASSMPGFYDDFGSTGGSFFTSGGAGVLVSHETYVDIFDLSMPTYVDKIFIKLQENKVEESSDIEDDINDLWKTYYEYELFNLQRRTTMRRTSYRAINLFFIVILTTTILICLFGLVSSSYSTIIERKKEIGILRTLGLKGKDINRLFVLESLIIMLSSGIIGVIVGWSTGWLLSSTMQIFNKTPYVPEFPFATVFGIFLLSILFIVGGMKIMLRRFKKKKITDIYRETT